jgi:hypothetical protein
MIFILAVVAVYAFILMSSIIEGATYIKNYLNKRKMHPIIKKFSSFILDLLCLLIIGLFFGILLIII